MLSDEIQLEQEVGAEIPKELLDAGVFYGRTKSKTNPKMKQFVLANRNGIEIINVLKTIETLERALGFLKEIVKNGGLVLFVGTQPAAEDLVRDLGEKLKMPYVTRRWLGGTLTNFKVISKRVEHYTKTKSDFASGALQKYTKKERVGIDREIKKLEELMGGLVNLTRLPEALVVIDPQLHMTAVREARRLRIPVIALADVDADPDLLTHPVIANNKARKSIAWFLGKVEETIREGISMKASLPASVEQAPSEK